MWDVPFRAVRIDMRKRSVPAAFAAEAASLLSQTGLVASNLCRVNDARPEFVHDVENLAALSVWMAAVKH
jgi:hypothetical protein